ncbi:hypothetical protein [Azonexus hydrophilus]|uniref:Uncharacterized protein n=1 Tax=Azonexus hydrophilus TaxID=418702 RepID=A0ABZ2XLT4_9RHOO
MTDMTRDLFAEQPYGKIALAKMGAVPENFRLYQAGWLGNKPEEWTVMKVIGAEFRAAKSGPNKGKLTIPVEGTTRTAFVTAEEIEAAPRKH